GIRYRNVTGVQTCALPIFIAQNSLDYSSFIQKEKKERIMNILLSNDDGFHAEGIQTLASHLRTFANVIIVAPDRNRSAASSALTLVEPLRPRQIDNGDYCVNGTPADCVYLAMNYLLAGKID